MPDPCSLLRILGRLQPTFAEHDVHAPVAGDVAASESVPLASAFGKLINRHLAEFTGALAILVPDQLVIGDLRIRGSVGEDLDLPVTVDVPGACGLDIADLGDDVFCPLLGRIASGVFPPAQRVAPPTTGNEVGEAVPIDVERDGGEIVEVFPVSLDLADGVFLAEIGSLIPIGSRNDVGNAVVVHIDDLGRLEGLVRNPDFAPFERHNVSPVLGWVICL